MSLPQDPDNFSMAKRPLFAPIHNQPDRSMALSGRALPVTEKHQLI